MTELLFLLIGLLVGAALMRFYNLYSEARGKNDSAGETARLELLAKNGEESKTELERRQNEITDLYAKTAADETEIKFLRENLAEKVREIKESEQRFREIFERSAGELMDKNSRRLGDENRLQMESVLGPLKEKIKAFEQKIEQVYVNESKERFSLEKEIRQLAELNRTLGREATNLTKALRGQSKVQGDWGEMILERILEQSGLRRGHEFFVQQTFTDRAGKRFRPDVTVAYPGNRQLVVDAKVSLTAYERFSSSENPEASKVALNEHLKSVRAHVNELAGKNYPALPGLNSLDFVMLFMPIEAASLEALRADPDLWKYAYDRRVLIVGPANLLTALKMISELWRREARNKNALEIAEQSGALYDKLAGFIDDLTEIGKKIGDSQRVFEAATNKLYTGKGNLLSRAERLKALGAKAKKEIRTGDAEPPELF